MSQRAEAWVLFDHIVSAAAPDGAHSNPWVTTPSGELNFEPDYATLELLLGVPLHLDAGTTSGVPALALDVWLSYELRRAGFTPDKVWPRPENPRILPAPVSALLTSLPATLQSQVRHRIAGKSSIPGVTSSSGNILGKNYLKQVDVIMTDWWTGPEILISTKRMDSSYGKNAPNRIEESYGDAKNLRLRHPLAALGFAFGLRSDILHKEPKTADWLFDLLGKLGQEDDAYHATCVILMEYGDSIALADQQVEPGPEGILEAGTESVSDEEDLPTSVSESTIALQAAALPHVNIVHDHTPPSLSPARFLEAMVTRVLNTTPINMHEDARARLRAASRPAS